MNVGEAAIELLTRYGVDTVFGIPGVHNLELYRGLARFGVRAVSPRHEQGAGFMADGWSRVTGRPGVCVVISGPGFTNLLTPIGQAFHDSQSMLVLSSTTPTGDLGRGHGPLHDLPDQALIARSITAFSETVYDAAELPELIAAAWAQFTARRPRPVHVTFPTDVLEMSCATLVKLDGASARPVPDGARVAEAAELLRVARHPIIIAGGGSIDAGPELRALAERLAAPVVLSGNAKGVLPTSHPLCVDNTLAFAPVQRALAAADAVIVVGSEVSDADIYNGGIPLTLGDPIVRIDIDDAQLDRRMTPTVAIVADAAAALTALIDALDDGAAPGSHIVEAEEQAASLRGDNRRTYDAALTPWLDAIEAALPDDRIVALDSTQLAYAAHSYLSCEHPRSWLAPFGYGTLGCAVPMAIGAKIAAPHRPVFALVGDGGWLFTMPEMATAVDERLDLVVVLWDNRGYGEIKASFDRVGAPRIGVDVSSADPEMVARGLGWQARTVDEPRSLEHAIVEAFAAGGPQFIRVIAPPVR